MTHSRANPSFLSRFRAFSLAFVLLSLPAIGEQSSRPDPPPSDRRAATSERYDLILHPAIGKLRSASSHLATLGLWESLWDKKLIPWDLGQPTPVVQHLVQTGTLPKGRALVPGCGSWSSSMPNVNDFTFLVADFFTWQPNELFDLIFDYKFFIAIHPHLRSAWAKKISDILKPNGELITLISLVSDPAEGPPYHVTVADYEEVLNAMGFEAVSIIDNELALTGHQRKEKLGRWKRKLNCPRDEDKSEDSGFLKNILCRCLCSHK